MLPLFLLLHLLLLLLLHPPSSAVPPAITGHLKPLFLNNPFSFVPVHNGYPPPSSFIINNFVAGVPLHMQSAMKLRNWTDARLRQKVDSMYVEVMEARKKKNNSETIQVAFTDFLNQYRDENWHLIGRLPPPLARETLLPYPLQCPGLDGAFEELHLSMAGGETKSMLQYTAESLFYCLERGSNDVMLVNDSTVRGFLKEIVDQEDLSASTVDVDKVDLNKFPRLRNLHVFKAHLKPGDCLFIPEYWLRYFHTGKDSYLAFALYLNKESARGALERIAKSCRKSPDVNLTLAKVRFQFDEDQTGASYGDGSPAWKVHGRRDDGKRSLADVVMETLAELLLAELRWDQEPSVNQDQFVRKLIGPYKASPQLLDIAKKLFIAADVNKDKVFNRYDVGFKLSMKRADLLEQLAKLWRMRTVGKKVPDLTRPLHQQDKKTVFAHRDEL